MEKTVLMTGLICLLALVIELDFFVALPKFGAEHFGAPDDLKMLVKKIPDKPRKTEMCGLLVMFAAFFGITAVIFWAAWDTYKNYQGMGKAFLRFLIILEGYKLFDIVCFDWFLMTKIRFPEKLYPQTKGAKGYASFGFNKKSQLKKMIIFACIAFAIALCLSWLWKRGLGI